MSKRRATALQRVPALALCLATLVVLWDRASVLEHFSFRYTDMDQVVYWSAAHEVSKGRFHEPRFYGQPYHHYLGAVVAAPLLGAGVTPQVALPVVAATISILPFLILAFCAWRRQLLYTAFAAVAMPLLLPITYSFITSMPRGFTTGILFCTVAACLTLAPLAARTSFFVGLLLPLSVSLVPSTATLALPVGIYALAKNFRNRSVYLWGGLGTTIAVVLHLAAAAFYKFHPASVVFPDIGYLGFSWADLNERLTRLSDFWGPVSPDTPLGPIFVPLALYLAYIVGLARRSHAAAAAVLLGGACLILSLGIAHVGVGSLSVFYPFARMYLPLPIFLLLAGLWLELASRPRLGSRASALLAVTVCLALLIPFWARRSRLEEETRLQIGVRSLHGLRAHRVASVENDCRQIGAIVEEAGADLVVFTSRSSYTVLAYSCEVLSDGRYKTLSLIGVGERRTWRLREVAVSDPRSVILFGIDRRRYLAGQALGATFGPPHQVEGAVVIGIELPEGTPLLEFLTTMGVQGAHAATRRLQL